MQEPTTRTDDVQKTEPVAPARALDASEIEALRLGVVEALHTVYDPEIPVDIYELGLIYDIAVAPSGDVAIKMTLTAPGCPVAGSMPDMVKDAVGTVESVGKVDVELVWDPPWDRDRMSETAQLALGMI
ncbi:MAG TPA: SUF system Fe-S cluster assembly protein [Candidatus Acidoferrum sp.]|nr:SUF system Fe-S cluster assembly protein [Candidatus Acidoferrum sp.]